MPEISSVKSTKEAIISVLTKESLSQVGSKKKFNLNLIEKENITNKTPAKKKEKVVKEENKDKRLM